MKIKRFNMDGSGELVPRKGGGWMQYNQHRKVMKELEATLEHTRECHEGELTELQILRSQLATNEQILMNTRRLILGWIQTGGTTCELVDILGGLDAILSDTFACSGCKEKTGIIDIQGSSLQRQAKEIEDKFRRLEMARAEWFYIRKIWEIPVASRTKMDTFLTADAQEKEKP